MRWIATVVGFVGVIITLNSSTEGLNIYALMSVGGALLGACITVSRLPLASFTSFFFFAEISALPTWIGAAFVVGATLYTTRKNARPLVASA